MIRPIMIPEKFWKNVRYRPDTGCWAWVGTVGGKSGYPVFGRRAAWKWAYVQMYGGIENWGSYSVIETCVGADSCANPDHRVNLPIDQFQTKHKCRCGDWHDPEVEQ